MVAHQGGPQIKHLSYQEMTVGTKITEDSMTSDQTRHTAARTADGWTVTWLPGRVLNRNQAITAMTIAEEAAGSLPWIMSEDGSTWRAQLPDGRTAVIERLDDGASFLPKVYESRSDFAVGPVCAGVLGAAAWAAGRAAGAQ